MDTLCIPGMQRLLGNARVALKVYRRILYQSIHSPAIFSTTWRATGRHKFQMGDNRKRSSPMTLTGRLFITVSSEDITSLFNTLVVLAFFWIPKGFEEVPSKYFVKTLHSFVFSSHIACRDVIFSQKSAISILKNTFVIRSSIWVRALWRELRWKNLPRGFVVVYWTG